LGAIGIPGFDGGGSTGNAPRAGGLDGKGGFLAMLHPRETVFDHTKGQGMAGVQMVNHYSIDARGMPVSDLEAMLDRRETKTVRKAVTAVAQARQRGMAV